MARFIEARRKPLLNSLNSVASLRSKDLKLYRELYEKNRAGVVSSFRRLEAIDKRERLLFSVFPLVFSPDDDAFDPAQYPLERDMFFKYLEVLLEESRRILK